MRLHSRLSWFLALGILGYAAAPAIAETGQTSAGATVQLGGSVGFAGRTTLSPDQELGMAQAYVSKAEVVASSIQDKLRKARQAHDVVKTLCLNDKMSQIDVAVRALKERVAALTAAAGRNDKELANHEFTISSVLSQRSEQLGTEGNQCVGEDTNFNGTTFVSAVIDSNIVPTGGTSPTVPVDIPPPPPFVPPGEMSPMK
jgi:hypothetical protein